MSAMKNVVIIVGYLVALAIGFYFAMGVGAGLAG